MIKLKEYNKSKILLVVLLFGAYLLTTFYFSIWVHEFTHKFEYKDIPKEKNTEELCALNVCKNRLNADEMGYYTFIPANKEAEEKALSIHKTSEPYAYSVQFIFYALLCGLGSGALTKINFKKREKEVKLK